MHYELLIFRQTNRYLTYNVMSLVCISKTQFLPALVLQISLGLTLSQYHIPGEECKSYPSNPNPVTAKLHVLPPRSVAGSHDLSPVPDMICGLGLEADGASPPLCCFRRRVQRVQQFSGSRMSSSRGGCSSGNKLTWLHHRRGRKSSRIPLKMEGRGATETWEFSRMNFDERASWLKTQRWNLFPLHFEVDARFLVRCYDTHESNWMRASSSSSVFESV